MRRRTFTTFIGAAGILVGQPLVFAQTLQTYHCRDGSEFVLGFYEYDRRAYLQLDGKSVVLAKRLSLAGSRYTKGGITLRMLKAGTTLTRGKRSTECTAD